MSIFCGRHAPLGMFIRHVNDEVSRQRRAEADFFGVGADFEGFGKGQQEFFFCDNGVRGDDGNFITDYGTGNRQLTNIVHLHLRCICMKRLPP